MSPYAPKRPCAAVGCSELVDRGRCPRHAREQDRARGTAQERGYDYEWSKFAKAWKARFPICGQRADGKLYAEHSRCVQEGRDEPAAAVDHIVSMRNGGSQYDPTNLQSLCVRCNARKRNQVDR
jgi:hypothetical protein